MGGQRAEMDAIKHRCIRQIDFNRIEMTIMKLQENIQSIIGELGSWKFFKTIFVSLLALLLASAITAVYQFTQLQSKVAKIQDQVASGNIDEKLNNIQSSLKTIELKK